MDELTEAREDERAKDILAKVRTAVGLSKEREAYLLSIQRFMRDQTMSPAEQFDVMFGMVLGFLVECGTDDETIVDLTKKAVANMRTVLLDHPELLRR